jgi:hypothetical protein
MGPAHSGACFSVSPVWPGDCTRTWPGVPMDRLLIVTCLAITPFLLSMAPLARAKDGAKTSAELSFSRRPGLRIQSSAVPGDAFGGVIALMSVVTPRNPLVLDTIARPGDDYYSLAFSNHGEDRYVVVSGGNENTGAFVGLLQFTDDQRLEWRDRLKLPGKAATHIQVTHSGAYVQSGDQGGVTELQLTDGKLRRSAYLPKTTLRQLVAARPVRDRI